MSRVPKIGDVVRCKRCAACVEVTRIDRFVHVTYADGIIVETDVAGVAGRVVSSQIVADSAVPWCLACGTPDDLRRDRVAADPTVN